MRTNALVVSLSVFALAACTPAADEAPADAGANEASSAPVSPSPEPQESSAEAPSSAEGVFLPLDLLRATPSAREWASDARRLASLELNDVDPFYQMPPIIGATPFWCLRSMLVDSLETGEVRRTYFFFYRDAPSPERPDDFALPDLSPGIEYQLANCSLRAVATELLEGDAPRVTAGWREELQGAFGAPAEVPSDVLPYGLLAAERLTWMAEDVAVAVGTGVTNAPVAMAALPIPEVPRTGWRQEGGRLRGSRTWRSEFLDLALEGSELPSETLAAIATIRTSGPPPRDLVLAVLRDLVARPATLELGDPTTERYAARLTVADLLLLTHYRYIPTPEDLTGFTSASEATQAEAALFNELGANFRYTELEYQTMYFGALGDSAAALPAAPGGWGGLGRMGSLETGCNWDPTLELTAELLPLVSQPRIRARLQYLRAEALSSILEFHHVKQLRPGVVNDIEALRREALELYRAALEGELGAEDRDVAWAMGWSVAMNEPLAPRYDCRTA